VAPAASFDDAETGVTIFVIVNSNQYARCVAGKRIQANIGRTKEEACVSVAEEQSRETTD